MLEKAFSLTSARPTLAHLSTGNPAGSNKYSLPKRSQLLTKAAAHQSFKSNSPDFSRLCLTLFFEVINQFQKLFLKSISLACLFVFVY